MYKMAHSSNFSDVFTIQRDTNTDLIVKKVKNSVSQTLTPTRRLKEDTDKKRNLVTSESYSVSNADYLELYYSSTADISSSTFVVTTINSYYNPSVTSDSTTTGTLKSSSSASTVGIVVAVGVVFTIILLVIVVVIVWYR
jgi:hypothetical protein